MSWRFVRHASLDFPLLQIGQYPLPRKQIEALFNTCDTVLVAEEGYPVYEELLRGYFGRQQYQGTPRRNPPSCGRA